MELVPVGRDLASLMCMESEYAGCHSPTFLNLRSFENDPGKLALANVSVTPTPWGSMKVPSRDALLTFQNGTSVHFVT
jgi:hypothetical protein